LKRKKLSFVSRGLVLKLDDKGVLLARLTENEYKAAPADYAPSGAATGAEFQPGQNPRAIF
jgi:hypothetical protein